MKPDRRNLSQNSVLHALIRDIANQVPWAGKKRTEEQWKVLLVSGHAMAAGWPVEIVPGLEGEFVNIRESTARMSKERATSLIEYVTAWAVGNGVRLTAPASMKDYA